MQSIKKSNRKVTAIFLFAVFVLLAISTDGVYGLVLTTEKDQYDYKILYAMGRYLRVYQDQKAMTFSDLAKSTYALRVGEPVYIIANGSKGKLGDMNGKEVAAYLKKIYYGRVSRANIFVYSDFAGAAYNERAETLIKDIRDWLLLPIKASICGPDGIRVTTENSAQYPPPGAERIFALKSRSGECFGCIEGPLEEKLKEKCPDCVKKETYEKIKDLGERAKKAFETKKIKEFFQELIKKSSECFLEGDMTCEEKK